MKYVHLLGGIVLAFVISVPVAYGQTQAGYRNFELGAPVSSVSTAAKSDAANIRTIHERPALIQDLEWRTPYSPVGPSTNGTDPVEQVDFSFYNDQLYKMVITYDHLRTTGMNDTDMVQGISEMYGAPLKPSARKTAAAARADQAEDGMSLARWEGADQMVVLYRSSDSFGSTTARYWLIVTAPRLDALAQTASAHAIRLDDREAPQREAAQQKKDAADARAADEKARATNKAAFRP
jgi:hypothetical protein